MHIHQYNIPTLLRTMACCLFSTKPLSEPVLQYCQLDPKENISVKFYSKFKSFYSRKCTWKCRLPKWRPSCPASICKINTSYDFIIQRKIWICFNHNVDTSCNVFNGTWNLTLPLIPFSIKTLYNDITWALRPLKSPAMWPFVQKIFQANNKANLQFCITGPLLVNQLTTGEFPSQGDKNGETFPCYCLFLSISHRCSRIWTLIFIWRLQRFSL